MLYEDGAISRTLAPEELEHLFADGRIDWPIITEKEIQDRSKGDFLSKGFAILQTTWFIIQCIVRGVYRLDFSQLEIVTLAFAALNGLVYFLWWNKPMSVTCPVPVQLLPLLTGAPHSSSKRETGIQTGDQFPSEGGDNRNSLIPSPEPPIIALARSETELIDGLDPEFVTKLEKGSSSSELHSSVPLRPSSTLARIWSYVWGKVLSMGPFAIIYILIYEPVKIIWCSLHDMLECDKVDNSHGTQSVPTFYAPESQKGGFSMVIGLIISAIFGGIHCIPWWFPFPSIKEQQLWRISAVTITVVPLFLIVLVAVGALIVVAFFKDHRGPWAMLINVFLGLFVSLILLAYIVARAALLILPLLALRSLSSSSFIDINWLVFIPHI